jgi:hypothetical protein
MGAQISLSISKIYENFLIPLYHLIFYSCTYMTEKTSGHCKEKSDLYLLEYGTYIRVYGATKVPHLLPKFVSDWLVLQEITYQTVIHGVGTTLYRDKNSIWPPLPLWVGS